MNRQQARRSPDAAVAFVSLHGCMAPRGLGRPTPATQRMSSIAPPISNSLMLEDTEADHRASSVPAVASPEERR